MTSDGSLNREPDRVPNASESHRVPPQVDQRLSRLVMTTLSPSTDQRPLPSPTLPFELGRLDEQGRADYVALEEIGKGQSARVYKGTFRRLSDHDRESFVAIKLFRAISNPEHFEEARREALRTDRVRDDHVVRVRDVGLWNERYPYVVQDYWQSDNLDAWTKTRMASKRTAPSVETCTRLIAGVAKGIAAAHAEGVIHGDIAPRNILVCNDNKARITDFGCASLGEQRSDHVVMGTRGFMPREQWQEGARLERSDVAALGGVLFWLLTGCLPYGETPEAIDALHADSDASYRYREELLSRSRVPESIALAVLRATHPLLEKRTALAREFQQELEAWLGPERRAPRPLLTPRRGLVLGLVIVVGVLAAQTLPFNRPNEMPRTNGALLAAWFETNLQDPACIDLIDRLGSVSAVTIRGVPLPPEGAARAALDLANSKRAKLVAEPDLLLRADTAMAVASAALEAKDRAETEYWLAVARDALVAPGQEHSERASAAQQRWQAMYALHVLNVRAPDGALQLRDALRLDQGQVLAIWIQRALMGNTFRADSYPMAELRRRSGDLSRSFPGLLPLPRNQQ